jgi:uncharacterized surface protein with fasciclin (FAS1) repeats
MVREGSTEQSWGSFADDDNLRFRRCYGHLCRKPKTNTRNRAPSTRLMFASLLHISYVSVGLALPTGAAGCLGGAAAVGWSHKTRGPALTKTGSLSDYGLELVLNRRVVKSPFSISVSSPHTLTVSGSKDYRGILFRLAPSSGRGADLVGALTVLSETLRDASDVCTLPAVGVTHTNRDYKNNQTVELDLDSVGSFILDITVVVENSAESGSEYYYSQFVLKAVDETMTGAPTPSTANETRTKSPTASATQSPSRSTGASNSSIFDIASSRGELVSFVKAVQQTDIDGALVSTALTLTTFGPNNAAMKRNIPEKYFDRSWTRHLRAVLLNHFVNNIVVLSTNVTSGTELRTFYNETISMTLSEGSVIGLGPTDGKTTATVAVPDLVGRNGVLHVVNGVLLPAFVAMSLTKILSKDSSFATFAYLLTQDPDLSDILDQGSAFTVFAPNNEAFEALPESMLLDPELVGRLLRYHIVKNEVIPSNGLTDGLVLSSLEGSTIFVEVLGSETTIHLQNISTVTAHDILAGNGIIHALSTVLLLDDIAANITAPTSTPSSTSPDSENTGTLWDTLLEIPMFSNITASFNLTGWNSTLDDPTVSLTLFCPTNSAFAATGTELLGLLWTPPFASHLENLVEFHLTQGIQKANSFRDGMNVTMVNAENITTRLVNDTVAVYDSQGRFDAIVIGPDVAVSNGMIHIVDRLLTPSFTSRTVSTNLPAKYSTFMKLLKESSLHELLQSSGPLMVFAPTNDAFVEYFDSTALTAKSSGPGNALDSVLRYHVVANASVPTSLLKNADVFTALSGNDITIAAQFNQEGNESQKTVYVNDASMIDPNILCRNGIVHGIDQVLVADGPARFTSEPTTASTSATITPTSESRDLTSEAGFTGKVTTKQTSVVLVALVSISMSWQSF